MAPRLFPWREERRMGADCSPCPETCTRRPPLCDYRSLCPGGAIRKGAATVDSEQPALFMQKEGRTSEKEEETVTQKERDREGPRERLGHRGDPHRDRKRHGGRLRCRDWKMCLGNEYEKGKRKSNLAFQRAYSLSPQSLRQDLL